MKFRSVEQFYQYCKGFYVAATRSPGGELTTASKTRLRAVQEACRKIMGTEDPAVCKFVGGQIEGLDKQVWDKARKEVMHAGVKLSFDPKVNPSAWESLDRTGNILITHVQAEPQTAEIFTSVLTDVRREWREEGFGKKYDRSGLVKPDTVLRTENSRLMAAYAGAERSMRSGESPNLCVKPSMTALSQYFTPNFSANLRPTVRPPDPTSRLMVMTNFSFLFIILLFWVC